MSSFTGLSPLIKRRILAYLEESEYRKVRSVSQEWDDSYRKDIGLVLNITNFNWEILQNEVNRSSKLASLNLSNTTLPLGQTIKLPGLMFLTSLSFHKITPTYNIIWSLIMFRNLKKLTFHLVLLESTKLEIQSRTLSLPLLENIYIIATTGFHDGNELEEMLTIESGNSIMEFISKIEYQRLRNVSLLCPDEVLLKLPFYQLFDPSYNLMDMPGLIRLLYNNRSTIQQFVAWSAPKQLALKWLFKPLKPFWRKPMQLVCFDSYLAFPTDWDIVFQTQNLLQFIRVNAAYKHWASVQGAISRSHDYLVKVYLAGGGFGSSVSLSGFKSCTKLTTLVICLDDCYLENIEDLPKSLHNLSINGPLNLKDLQIIANRLENLEDLYIDDNLPSTKYLYHGNNLVLPGTLSRSLVEDFLTLPIIRVLTFRNCRVDVAGVSSWLETIDGIEAEVFPVRGFPRNTFASMNIQVTSRKYNANIELHM